jgi:hypothetical protein
MPKKSDLHRKILALLDYVKNSHNVLSVIELCAALLQFTNRLSSFVNIARNMTFESATDRVRRAAWDCIYMRIPQDALAYGSTKSAALGFLLTQDRAAATISKLARLSALIVDAQKGPMIYWDPDMNAIKLLCDSDESFMTILEALENRPKMWRFEKPDFGGTIAELHEELRAFLNC